MTLLQQYASQDNVWHQTPTTTPNNTCTFGTFHVRMHMQPSSEPYTVPSSLFHLLCSRGVGQARARKAAAGTTICTTHHGYPAHVVLLRVTHTQYTNVSAPFFFFPTACPRTHYLFATQKQQQQFWYQFRWGKTREHWITLPKALWMTGGKILPFTILFYHMVLLTFSWLV